MPSIQFPMNNSTILTFTSFSLLLKSFRFDSPMNYCQLFYLDYLIYDQWKHSIGNIGLCPNLSAEITNFPVFCISLKYPANVLMLALFYHKFRNVYRKRTIAACVITDYSDKPKQPLNGGYSRSERKHLLLLLLLFHVNQHQYYIISVEVIIFQSTLIQENSIFTMISKYRS